MVTCFDLSEESADQTFVLAGSRPVTQYNDNGYGPLGQCSRLDGYAPIREH